METDSRAYDFNESNIKFASAGNWEGACATFMLQFDSAGYSSEYASEPDIFWLYYNYKMHFEFDGVLNFPTQTQYFNAFATYDHLTVNISINPQIQIATSGSSASIGFTANLGKERRVVTLPTPIYYEP